MIFLRRIEILGFRKTNYGFCNVPHISNQYSVHKRQVFNGLCVLLPAELVIQERQPSLRDFHHCHTRELFNHSFSNAS